MNKFSKYTNKEIKDILNESKSLKESILKFGYKRANSGTYNIIKKECKLRNIDIPKYNYFGEGLIEFIKKEKDNSEIFIENSDYSRSSLKKRIIRDYLIEYKCSGCGLDKWNNKYISLHLEHINGINNDNRIENLTLLCPNCHSQTDTFSGKKNKIFYYCECGKEILKKSKKCVKCSNIAKSKKQRKVKRPSYNILIKEIEKLGYTGTGEKYGVSDNSIRKWIKSEISSVG